MLDGAYAMTLRDGSLTLDPRLDALEHFDERSRSFRAGDVSPREIRGRTWSVPAWLDQGREGACVGYAIAHELAGVPTKVAASDALALKIYHGAQDIDPWPETHKGGEGGTDLLSGIKIARDLGYYDEFRWAFTMEEGMRGVQRGPVLVAIPWLDSMFDTTPDGLLDCSGAEVGRHAVCWRGLLFKWRPTGSLRPLEVVKIRNSWGMDWGQNGDCFIRLEDFDNLRRRRGEICVPVKRRGGNT